MNRLISIRNFSGGALDKTNAIAKTMSSTARIGLVQHVELLSLAQ